MIEEQVEVAARSNYHLNREVSQNKKKGKKKGRLIKKRNLPVVEVMGSS
jgi:hypothetical protein